jgi:hypothetical protein
MYTELHAHSHFSFLDGAAAPEALATRAAELGMDALAVTGHKRLYGAIKHRNACREAGIRPIYGAAVTLADGGCLTLLVEDATGWANLCRLLSAAGLSPGRNVSSNPGQAGATRLAPHDPSDDDYRPCLSGPTSRSVHAPSSSGTLAQAGPPSRAVPLIAPLSTIAPDT